jgi:hypothetical protein
MSEYWKGIIDCLFWLSVVIANLFILGIWLECYTDKKRQEKWTEEQKKYWDEIRKEQA